MFSSVGSSVTDILARLPSHLKRTVVRWRGREFSRSEPVHLSRRSVGAATTLWWTTTLHAPMFSGVTSPA